MTTTRHIDQAGLITTRVTGDVTVADMLDALIEAGELTAYSEEIWHRVILAPDVLIQRDTRAKMESAHNAKEMVQFKARGAVALVASGQRLEAFCHLIVGLLRGDAIPVVVFTDEDDADHWFRIRMSHINQTRSRATSVESVTRTATGF